MPQLWCGLENLWFPNRGRMSAESKNQLPMPCPMSQIFDLDKYILGLPSDTSHSFSLQSAQLLSSLNCLVDMFGQFGLTVKCFLHSLNCWFLTTS